MNHSTTTRLTPTEAIKRGFTIDTRVYPNIGYKGPRFSPRQTVEVYTELEEKLLDKLQNPLGRYTIAAFMAAGLRSNAYRLTHVQDKAQFGDIELVTALMGYVDYTEALYQAGLSIIGDVPGVFEYEVCMPFGKWVIDTMMNNVEVESIWEFPDHAPACIYLRELVYQFYKRTGYIVEADKLNLELGAVPLPEAPQL